MHGLVEIRRAFLDAYGSTDCGLLIPIVNSIKNNPVRTSPPSRKLWRAAFATYSCNYIYFKMTILEKGWPAS